MPTPPKPELLEEQKRLVRDLLLLEYELGEFRKLVEQPIDIDHRDNPSVNKWPKQWRRVEADMQGLSAKSQHLLAEFLNATHWRSFWNYKRHGNDRDQVIKHTFDPDFLLPEEPISDTNTDNETPNEGSN